MGVRRDFMDEFGEKIGTIEGGNGQTVKLNGVYLSTFASPEWYHKTFGCPKGQFALLVMYMPERVPAGTKLAVFPKVFDGAPVYYAPGLPTATSSPK
jgi:hypothetical protein